MDIEEQKVDLNRLIEQVNKIIKKHIRHGTPVKKDLIDLIEKIEREQKKLEDICDHARYINFMVKRKDE